MTVLVEDPTAEALDVSDSDYWPPRPGWTPGSVVDMTGINAVIDWLAEHKVDANEVYRLELHGPALRVFEFDRNANGAHYVVDGDIATRAPYDVALRSPAPVPFRPAA